MHQEGHCYCLNISINIEQVLRVCNLLTQASTSQYLFLLSKKQLTACIFHIFLLRNIKTFQLGTSFIKKNSLYNYNHIFLFLFQGASQCGPQIPRDFKARSHSLLITSSNFIIPLSVMSFCYYKIFREIHVHMDRIRKTSNIDLENSVQQQKKVATTLFLVLACFLLCWLPFVIYSNAAAFSKNDSAIPLIANPLVSFILFILRRSVTNLKLEFTFYNANVT